jgi:hypothetical protein
MLPLRRAHQYHHHYLAVECINYPAVSEDCSCENWLDCDRKLALIMIGTGMLVLESRSLEQRLVKVLKFFVGQLVWWYGGG